MNTESKIQIPLEAANSVSIVEDLIGSDLVGIYLFGSAVVGGLRANSDVDVLVFTDMPLSVKIRKELVYRLMKISSKSGNKRGVRPLELTVVNLSDVVPWRYPPRSELVYGEWLREEFENNRIPPPGIDPDLAIVLTTVWQNSIPLCGPDFRRLLAPIPASDLYIAIAESLPNIVGGLLGDERNVLLTLARMWITASRGEIVPKDVAATWAINKLPESLRPVLNSARKAYIGEVKDNWENRGDEIALLANHMKLSIEDCLVQKDLYKP